MKPIITALLASSVCLIASTQALAQGDAKAGREKSFTCSGCHASAGMRNAYPGYTVPKLGGQNAEYLKIALKAYRDGARGHPTMHAQVAEFTDEDIANVAAYFATLPIE